MHDVTGDTELLAKERTPPPAPRMMEEQKLGHRGGSLLGDQAAGADESGCVVRPPSGTISTVLPEYGACTIRPRPM